MSKAFTKDDDQADAPLVPRRAPLPAGVSNYVTPSGLAALREELAALTAELARVRAEAASGDSERTRAAAALGERLSELEARIGSAELVTPPEAAPSEIRFGASVTVRNAAGALRTYRIVGVDEAKASAGRIAFIAPLARALLGKRAGDAALVRTPQGEEELEVIGFEYERPAP